MAAAAMNTFTNRGICPFFPGFESKCIHVRLAPSLTLARGTVLGEINLSDVWSLATGTQASGTFTMSFGGQTTTAIARNASAATIQTALRALSTFGTNVTVVLASGTPGTDAVYTITFTGTLVNTTNGNLTADFALMGTPGNASLTHTITGQPLGTYKAYNDSNTDGSQTARAVLQYDCASDSAGLITFGGASTGGPYGGKSTSCPAFVEGTFHTTELVGLDAAGVADLGRIIEGTLASGLLRMP
jgi:hypothetical protein